MKPSHTLISSKFFFIFLQPPDPEIRHRQQPPARTLCVLTRFGLQSERYLFSFRHIPAMSRSDKTMSTPVFDNTQSGAAIANEVGIHPGGPGDTFATSHIQNC
jgi:hypothetical protein